MPFPDLPRELSIDSRATQAAKALDDLEALYRSVLELTLRQETCLRGGDVASLSAILAEKAGIVAQADGLIAPLAHTAGRSSAPFQEGLRRLGGLVAQVVAAEERCKALAPSSQPPSPRRVLSAYTAAAPAAHSVPRAGLLKTETEDSSR